MKVRCFMKLLMKKEKKQMNFKKIDYFLSFFHLLKKKQKEVTNILIGGKENE